jgi:hypothetical protein
MQHDEPEPDQRLLFRTLDNLADQLEVLRASLLEPDDDPGQEAPVSNVA